MAKKTKQKKLIGEKESFVEEPTGSATMINLDGRWDRDFTDHEKN
ncbi:hypothetical protein [Desulfotruncus alcoholivorax]|nr:hypothetical protein [Desulfotruncus alcoholivorax]